MTAGTAAMTHVPTTRGREPIRHATREHGVRNPKYMTKNASMWKPRAARARKARVLSSRQRAGSRGGGAWTERALEQGREPE